MRLKYIFHGQEKEPHPFYVKSHWEPPVQPSVALENYLEGVKTELAEIKLSKQKQNLSHKECQTPDPLRIPVFYTLTKIHKPTPVGRSTISGCDGQTERISSFVDYILQPIAKSQKSYLKDTKDFINFVEKTKIPHNAIMVSLDVTSLYTNIPQDEGIETICKAYETFYQSEAPIPTNALRKMLRLILQENSFQFCGKDYLQTHGTAMGTKMAVAFANIFMSTVATDIINKSKTKPLEWKRYIDDIFSLWDATKEEIDLFILEANRHHTTIKFTADISERGTNFLDTTVFKGERFCKESILDIRTHFKPSETFQYMHFFLSRPRCGEGLHQR